MELDVVEILIDDGYSASKGHHLAHGNFGKFLAEAEAGKFKGYALIVERTDRLSRLGIDQTNQLFRRLLKSGVVVHITEENRCIKSLDDLVTYIINGVQNFAAQEYTDKLSERLLKANKGKRENAKPGIPLDKKVPAWLAVEGQIKAGSKIINPGHFVLIPEMVQAIRDMFDLAERGIGSYDIFSKMNGRLKSYVHPCERPGSKRTKQGLSWTWVMRTLRNRAVLGWYQYKDNAPVMLYPAIIDQSQFDTVQARIDARIRKDGKFHGGRTGSTETVDNLFTGLVYNSTPGGEPRSMYYQKCERGAYFRTTRSGDNRPAPSIRYPRLQENLLDFLSHADWKNIAGARESDELNAAQAQLETLLGAVDTTSQRIARANKAMDGEIDIATLRVLAGRIAKDEAALVTLVERKNSLEARVNAERAHSDALYNPQEILDLIQLAGVQDAKTAAEVFDLRSRLKMAIRERVSRIDIDFAPDMEGIIAQATVTFANGCQGCVFFRDQDKSSQIRLPASASTKDNVVA
jgi:hypothetical protein